MAYLTQVDLENRMGAPRVLALYDDANTGVVNNAALTAVLQTASDLVDGTVARTYTGTLPLTSAPPALMKEAATLYAMALSIERKFELLSRDDAGYVDRLRKRADTLCEEIVTALKRMVDAPPPTAGSSVTGGLVVSTTTMLTVVDGSNNTGDF